MVMLGPGVGFRVSRDREASLEVDFLEDAVEAVLEPGVFRVLLDLEVLRLEIVDMVVSREGPGLEPFSGEMVFRVGRVLINRGAEVEAGGADEELEEGGASGTLPSMRAVKLSYGSWLARASFSS